MDSDFFKVCFAAKPHGDNKIRAHNRRIRTLWFRNQSPLLGEKYPQEHYYFAQTLHAYYFETKHFNNKFLDHWSDTNTSTVDTSDSAASGYRLSKRKEKMEKEGKTEAPSSKFIQAEHLDAMQDEVSMTDESADVTGNANNHVIATTYAEIAAKRSPEQQSWDALDTIEPWPMAEKDKEDSSDGSSRRKSM